MPVSRVGEIERARDAKEAALRPDEITRTKRFLRGIKEKKLVERIPSTASAYSCLTLPDRKTPSHSIDVFFSHTGGTPRIAGIETHC